VKVASKHIIINFINLLRNFQGDVSFFRFIFCLKSHVLRKIFGIPSVSYFGTFFGKIKF